MSSTSSTRSGALGVVRVLVLTALFLAAVIGGVAIYIGGYPAVGFVVALVGAGLVGAVAQRRT